MSGYVKTNWIDDVTPLSATNFNKMETELYKRSLLYSDSIQGTTQTPTFTNSQITKIEHKNGSIVIRTDTFTYSATKITEIRTLNTSETITLEYNFDSSGNYTGTVVT